MTTPSEPSYRLIPLTRGQFAIVDAEDYEWLMQWKWTAVWNKKAQKFYAVRKQWINKKQIHIQMHRQIMKLSNDDPRMIDHIHGDTLDNRKSQLRIATSSENQWNRVRQKNNTSGAKGVCWKKDKNKWRVSFNANKKCHFIGYFGDFEEACRAYRDAVLKVHGNFARISYLNSPTKEAPHS